MITCTLDDSGLTYRSNSVSDIANKLYDYIMENYGVHTVTKIPTEAVYKSCKLISSVGEYLIKTKSQEIYCVIK